MVQIEPTSFEKIQKKNFNSSKEFITLARARELHCCSVDIAIKKGVFVSVLEVFYEKEVNEENKNENKLF